MQGLVRLTYWLGWLFFIVAIVARIATYTEAGQRLVYLALFPHNFLQFAFLFFIASIATALYNRAQP